MALFYPSEMVKQYRIQFSLLMKHNDQLELTEL